MIRRVCTIVKVENNYFIQPSFYSSLNNMCLTSCTNHIGNNIDSKFIFDFRRNILNKKFDNDLEFHLILVDENSQVININDNIRGNSIVYTFNRKKERINKQIALRYYPKVEKFNINVNSNHIYLGNTKKIDMKQVAYETKSCFSEFYSPNGGGYYGFCINFQNLDVDPKYAILFIHNKKIVESKNNNIFLNNRINDIITETYYSDEKYIEPLVPLIYENIVPSAPLIYEDVVPSAPIIYEEDV